MRRYAALMRFGVSPAVPLGTSPEGAENASLQVTEGAGKSSSVPIGPVGSWFG
ncbi:MAG: hypothetical protein GY722_15775 [bacterium]|nr:hypothetical protein [bacterium]